MKICYKDKKCFLLLLVYLFGLLNIQHLSAQCDFVDNGRRYIGDCKTNVVNGVTIHIPDGEGKQIYPDESYFVGKFSNGQRISGQYYWKGGYYVDSATYENDNLKSGIYNYPNGAKYKGTFKNDEFDGSGVYYYESGRNEIRYEGAFKNGMYKGYGVLTYKDGSTDDGLWKDDVFLGAKIGEYQKQDVLKKGDTIITFNNKYLLSQQQLITGDEFIPRLNKYLSKGTFIIETNLQEQKEAIGYITTTSQMSNSTLRGEKERFTDGSTGYMFYEKQSQEENISASLLYKALQNSEISVQTIPIDFNNLQNEYYVSTKDPKLIISIKDVNHKLIAEYSGKTKVIENREDTINLNGISLITLKEVHNGTEKEVAVYHIPIKFYPNRIAVFVHGTNVDTSTWTANEKTIPLLLKIANTPNYDAKFYWFAPLLNNYFDREKAANSLVQYIEKYNKIFDEIILIGHSHGGNVAIQSVNNIKGFKKIYLFTLATPTYNCDKFEIDKEGGINPDIYKLAIKGSANQENPVNINNSSFQCHVHVGNENDKVAGGISQYTDKGCESQKFYYNDITLNIDLNVSAETFSHSIQQSTDALNILQSDLQTIGNPFIDNVCKSRRVESVEPKSVITTVLTTPVIPNSIPENKIGGSKDGGSSSGGRGDSVAPQTIPISTPTTLTSASTGEQFTAQPGDTFEGEMKDGKVVQGKVIRNGETIKIFWNKRNF